MLPITDLFRFALMLYYFPNQFSTLLKAASFEPRASSLIFQI
jgi:hypothetical protein